MRFDCSRAWGHGASAKSELRDKIYPSMTDKYQTAVTTALWDLGRADGNHCRTV